MICFHPNNRSAATTFQRRLECHNQIFRFFFKLEVTIANYAEIAIAVDFVMGEETCDETFDYFFQANEMNLFLSAFRQPNKARHPAR